jgi:RHH-type transcriptional regulator, rel operon repressor / antitoxin RelB
MSSVISIRLEEEINNQLSVLAEATHRTRPTLIHQAIQDYLNQHQTYLQAIEESIREVEAGMALSHDEVKEYWKEYFENKNAH